jgi:hypothetical protein
VGFVGFFFFFNGFVGFFFFLNGFVIGLGFVPVDDLQAAGEVGKRRGLWVFVWGIEDLDLCFCFCFCCFFCYVWRGRQLARERKKLFLFP